VNTITVVNVKTAKPGSFVYCGRYNSTYGLQSSPLANPFKLSREGCRQTLLVLYRSWLYAHRNDKAIAAEISRLASLLERGDVAIGCWCAPKACHCDVIADFVRRECARRQAVAAMQREPTVAPTKRSIAGLETVAGEAELGPIFQMGEE
jgi:hypothetical protein